MIYIKWFLLLIVNLTTNLIAMPLTPIVVLFSSKDGWLPNWLWYFQTPDNSLEGDTGWQNENAPYRPATTRFQKYWNRVRWLWRNRLYGFSAAVLSVKFKPSDTILYSGNVKVGNGPCGISGICISEIWREGTLIGFKYYYVRQYKKYPTKCIRILLGWKVPNEYNHNGGLATFGFSLSPWMHFIE